MWDKMVQNDVMCHNALYVEGAGRLAPHATNVGTGGGGIFFAKISSEKDILGQF